MATTPATFLSSPSPHNSRRLSQMSFTIFSRFSLHRSLSLSYSPPRGLKTSGGGGGSNPNNGGSGGGGGGEGRERKYYLIPRDLEAEFLLGPESALLLGYQDNRAFNESMDDLGNFTFSVIASAFFVYGIALLYLYKKKKLDGTKEDFEIKGTRIGVDVEEAQSGHSTAQFKNFKEAELEFLSGYTEIDKIARTKEMYFEFETKNNAEKKGVLKSPLFAFDHFWKVLKKVQQWLETCSAKKLKEGDDTFFTPRTVERPRPGGKKFAKEGRIKRKENFVYGSSAVLEKMNQTVTLNEKNHNDVAAMLIENGKKMDAFLGMQREILELKKIKFGMEMQMFDMDIALKAAEFMKVDISSMHDPDQIEFYRTMKKNIKAKYQVKH